MDRSWLSILGSARIENGNEDQVIIFGLGKKIYWRKYYNGCYQ